MVLFTSKDLSDTAAQFWRLRGVAHAVLTLVRRPLDGARVLASYRALPPSRLEDIGLTESDLDRARQSPSAAAEVLSEAYRTRRAQRADLAGRAALAARPIGVARAPGWGGGARRA